MYIIEYGTNLVNGIVNANKAQNDLFKIGKNNQRTEMAICWVPQLASVKVEKKIEERTPTANVDTEAEA
uniref:Uncharacterized protein n=1 Tax=Psilocybe cubensis TaxID=181762 RepID=A0A8H7Y1Z3_PSICU